MDSVVQFLFDHAEHAHFVIFGLLLLGGFNLPMSEDLIIIFAGVLAATVIPEHTVILFLSVYLGCTLADWICYWMGRRLGPKLWKFKWVNRLVNKRRLAQIQNYYSRYGFRTLLLGRFIPFGVRNCLFLAAGLSKMPFKKFILYDAIACFTTNSVLFSLAYLCGKNIDALFDFLKTFNILIFTVFVVSIIAVFWYKRRLAFHKKHDKPRSKK